jgi:hypothetical protein
MVALGVVALVAVAITPALGGPSLKKLVSKEVKKQLANRVGPKGEQGQKGEQGPPGPPGAAATPPGGTLPASTTLTGVWAPFNETTCSMGCVTGSGEGISFGGYALPSRPLVYVVGPAAPAPSQCPGSVAAPTAISGHLCLYIGFTSGNTTTGDALVVTDPVPGAPLNGINYAISTGVRATIGDGRVDRRGFKLTHVEGEGNISQARGTWAVTG